MSPPQLASKLAVSDRTVRNWMGTTGRPVRPNVENLRDLCAYLGISREEFEAAAKAHDARQQSETSAPAAADRVPRRRVALLLLLVIAAAAVTVVLVRARITAPARIIEIPPDLPGVYESARSGRVSPDGAKVAFVGRSVRTQRSTLFVYSMADGSTRALPETEGNYTSWFWHNDSQSIFFITQADLMKVRISGGVPERVGHAPEALRGAVNRDGVVILGSRKGLLRIDDTGSARPLTKISSNEVAHSTPWFLPNQKHVLFTITKRNPDNTSARVLAVASIVDSSTTTLLPIPSRVEYANGQLLYVRDRTLVARPFDEQTLRFTGREEALATPVWVDRITGEAGFSCSETTIVVTPPPRTPPLYHVTSGGGVQTVISEPADIRHIGVGRVTNQLALAGTGEGDEDVSLWLYSLHRRQASRLAAVHAQPRSLLFSHDDSSLYYAALGTSWDCIYALPLRGKEQFPHRVIDPPDVVAPRDISADGRYLLFQRWPTRDGNLWFMPVDDPSAARPLIATPEDEGESARFSPDGKQVAFVARRGEIYSVYVTDFPPTGRPVKKAIRGDGWRARWRPDGKRIYFARGSGVFEADPATQNERLLFRMSREIELMEPARDGGFFVREKIIDQSSTVATRWWPRLRDRPLNLSSVR